MYGMYLDALSSITFDSTVTVPNVKIDNEETYLNALQHVDPLSPDHDDDYDINCCMIVKQRMNDIINEINYDH